MLHYFRAIFVVPVFVSMCILFCNNNNITLSIHAEKCWLKIFHQLLHYHWGRNSAVERNSGSTHLHLLHTFFFFIFIWISQLHKRISHPIHIRRCTYFYIAISVSVLVWRCVYVWVYVIRCTKPLAFLPTSHFSLYMYTRAEFYEELLCLIIHSLLMIIKGTRAWCELWEYIEL